MTRPVYRCYCDEVGQWCGVCEARISVAEDERADEWRPSR